MKILKIVEESNTFSITALVLGRERIIIAPNLDIAVDKIFGYQVLESREEIKQDIELVLQEQEAGIR